MSFFFFYQTLKLTLALKHFSTAINQFGSETMLKANLYLLAGNTLLFLVSYFVILRSKVSFSFIREDIESPRLKPIYLFYLFVIALGFWNLFFNTNYFLKNNDYLTWNTPISYIYYQSFAIFQMSTVALTWVFLRKRNYFFCSLSFLVTFIFTAYLGSRTIPAFLLAIFFTDYFENVTFKRGFILRDIGSFVILSLFAFVCNNTFRITKNLHIFFYNELTSLSETVENVSPKKILNVFKKASASEVSHGESTIILNLYHIFHLDYTHKPYREGATLKRVFLTPVPTKYSFGLKPENMIYVYARDILSHVHQSRKNDRYSESTKENAPQKSSILPTFWGDAYANHGALGFMIYAILLPFYVLCLTKIQNHLSGYAKTAFLGIAITYILMISRGTVSISISDTILSLAALIPLSLMDTYILKRMNKRAAISNSK